jgi:dTDP-4-dehydrorhamnose reductase
MKILVLGANGMIGSTMLHVISERATWLVNGAVRNEEIKKNFPSHVADQLVFGNDLTNTDHLARLFDEVKPNVVVNCAGLTKHLPTGNEPIPALTMNALLPHRLAVLCSITGSRLIHISTDCVFSGKAGNYKEVDQPDAIDIYGKTKHLGEVTGTNQITLRTSTIGHEICTRFGLLEWFLAQDTCQGYRRAFFSGLPTVEFARIVRDVVIPNEQLSGLYHVGGASIDKYSLLCLIAKSYGMKTTIVPDDQVSIDRSLNTERFFEHTGYKAPDWPELIEIMRRNQFIKR